MLYSRKGAKAEESTSFTSVAYNEKTTSRLHYLDVPILARLKAGGLFVELGSQMSFLVVAKERKELSGGYGPGSYSEQNSKNNLKSIDFGYVGGLGYQLRIGLGLHYNGGFTDIRKKSGPAGVHNSAFQLYLGVMVGGQ